MADTHDPALKAFEEWWSRRNLGVTGPEDWIRPENHDACMRAWRAALEDERDRRRALARRALGRIDRSKRENVPVEVWADRLANDVKDMND